MSKQVKVLNPVLTQELFQLGAWLRQLRIKQHFTIKDLSIRIGANPRTINKIEKGDPTVSLGTFFQYINMLGLAKGVSLRILGDYIHAIAELKKKKVFTDEEMNF